MKHQETPKICPICKQGKEFEFIRDFERMNNTFSLYQCSKCLVQFWLPLKAAECNWYEQRNPYRMRELVKAKVYRGYHKKFFKKYKNFSKRTKVLDIGCGAGEFIFELKKRGCEVWGVDFDRGAIKIAKQRFNLENVYSLSFEEFFQKKNLPKFDVITFFEVIEHLDNPLEFIKNIKKILKPGGKIVLSAPYRERMLLNFNNWDFPPHHFTRWNKEAIVNIFEKQGFYIADIDYVEQLKILSESIVGKFRTGLVGKSLTNNIDKKKSLFFPKIIYFLGRFKDFVFGKIPASFLWFFSKIINRKNGIMLIELEKKCSGLPVRKKIIFFLPTLSIGGGERVVSDLSLNFPDFIETVIVLLKNKVSYPYKGKLVCLDVPLSNSLLLRIYYFFICLFRFKKIIKKEKPDYVISFGPPLNIINLFSNKKNVLRVDNVMSSSGKSLIYKILIRFFYNKAPKIICVSRVSAEDLINNFGIKKEKITVIYNPLKIKEIQSLISEPLEPEYEEIFKKPVIITVGRLTKQKNQKCLIRTFSEVKNKIKEARLVILGKGELEPELKLLVKDLKMEGNVHFLGWQKNPFKFLARAKVFVLSSLWEGLPCVVLEAMACSLPIISADCKSGPREILASGTDIKHQAEDIEYAEFGILTPIFKEKNYKSIDSLAESEKKLAEAVIKVLTDKKLSDILVEKSKQRAEDFDIKKIIKKWDFLYDEKT